MNLITDLWIPVRLADGTRTTIRPSEITDRSNPPVALDAPRADFNSALAQFLIGLLQTAFAPGDGDEWIHRLEEPPCVEMLDQAFGGHADAFVLNGEGPRFMQDLERFDQGGTDKRKPAKKNSVASLLIDTPGDKTLKNNADHFIKRDRIEALCPACAATALFTLQINAPGGGAGHRTSLRGGGPLTTLVALDPEGSELPDTLWHNLWLNVLPRTVRLTGNPVLTDPEHIFPWLATTRTSNPKEGGLDTTPEDAHPLQMYWAMPRRIRLDFENTKGGDCDLCGTQGPLVQRYFTLNYGTNYTGAWRHPLSPYQEQDSAEPLPRHPQPGGIGYRHWLGLVYAWQDDKQRIVPARVVDTFLRESEGMGQARIWAFGYDMDNMKPRCWYEAIMPLYHVPNDIRERFTTRIGEMIQAADRVTGMLRTAVKEAWFKRPGDARGNTNFLSDGFYQHTEADFYACLTRLIERIREEQDRSVLAEWHLFLCRAALALFDEWAASGDLAFGDPARVARARSKLLKQINSKKIRQILSLPNTKEKAT